ncbi:GntR family transcriptional regulator [Devosia sp. Naph2]|uniref:GntR family transcriptional regulator n=1 Tax=Devosia polycyclovorans TaxID=3345148 RepID=UPI0035CEC81F
MNSLVGIKRPGALAEEVYSRLYDQLMTQGIASGAKLSVDGLARALDVSQTPVREALARLEAQGLVVKVHLVGYRVAPPMDRARLDQIYELRLLTEPRLATLAAERISAGARDELLSAAKQMEAESTAHTPEAYARFSRLDEAFHRQIAAASGNGVIADALAALHVHVHLFRLSQPRTVIADAIVEHLTIVQAIVARDARAAENAMRDHIVRSRRRFAEEGSRHDDAEDGRSPL